MGWWWGVRFVLDQLAELGFYSASYDMSLHSDTLSWFRANQSLLFPFTNAIYRDNLVKLNVDYFNFVHKTCGRYLYYKDAYRLK
jgi:hypothetical protein